MVTNMAAKKITEEQWKFAKVMWQAEPLKTLSQLAESLNVSKQLVARKAREQEWKKCTDIDALAKRAYEIADARSACLNDSEIDENAEVRPSGMADVVDKVASNNLGSSGLLSVFELQRIAVRDAASKRASILERHRNEINGARKLLYEAIKGSGDIETAKLAKVVAETMKTLQEAERKSWGFERDDNKPAPTIIIERGRHTAG